MTRQIAKDRLEAFCSIYGRVFNENPWFTTSLAEYQICIEVALENSNLPESWIKLGSERKLIVSAFTSFRALGYCFDSKVLRQIEESLAVRLPLSTLSRGPAGV